MGAAPRPLTVPGPNSCEVVNVLDPQPIDPRFQQPEPVDDPEEMADDGNRVVGEVDRDEFDPAELADDANRVVQPDEEELPT
ncbi:hypothetical protein [Longimycelium tulufanense]|uniref:hypothetical protein n=1 Tax=Longimycelium tulufanense TaxID=907463 RepID=UPI001667BB1E|nr:hypothetical protein [Longimycelium tulufanense]